MNNTPKTYPQIAAVIPSLDPDRKLRETLDSLIEVGFRHIIVVNDGSSKENLKYFPENNDVVNVLHHEKNLGKGAALKNAFAYIRENLPDIKSIVTVDGDGQHRSQDALKVALNTHEKGIVSLGGRDFSQPHVPTRSKIGNKSTSLAFLILFGLKINDTQTGLRAFPHTLLEQLCMVEGERFEYETNQLLEFKKFRVKYEQVIIETVYSQDADAPHTSHFRTFYDAFRIFKVIFKFVMSSVLALFLDVVLFTLIVFLADIIYGKEAVNNSVLFHAGEAFKVKTVWLIAFVPARLVSSFVNYLINLKVVFANKNKRIAPGAIYRYYTLAACILILTMIVFNVTAELLGIRGAFLGTLLNVAIQGLIFFASFRFQHNWVYKSKQENPR
ncbi:MAG: glycosyltransferase family 2 protein [Oscillospiraceae bacterium]|nr:glycosyltransferase family 2 protein [Oscillospiraceae bacterium]